GRRGIATSHPAAAGKTFARSASPSNRRVAERMDVPQSRTKQGEVMNPRAVIRTLSLVMVFLLGALSAHAQDSATEPQAAPPAATPADPQAVADSIAKEVAQIRGLSFKQPVAVEKQSPANFGEYVSRRIDETVPEPVRSHYGTIVRTLGLYR